MINKVNKQFSEQFCYACIFNKKKTTTDVIVFLGGQRWIRTTEDRVGRFTVCSLWPLGNLPIFELVELVIGIEPTTC